MALSEIEKLERRYAENPQGLTFAPLAEVHRKNGDIARALDLLRPGLELHPDYIPASIVLGRCHLDLGDLPSAETAFSHVLELDGENVIALKALADINERLHHFDQAERWLHQLLALDRSNDEARAQLERIETARVQASEVAVRSSVSEAAADAPATGTAAEAAADTGIEAPAEEPPPVAVQEPEPVSILDPVEPPPAEYSGPPTDLDLEELEVVDATSDESVEQIHGLIGLDADRPEAGDWMVETSEDIVLRSSGGGEFQVPDASQELFASKQAPDPGPFSEPKPIETPPEPVEEPPVPADLVAHAEPHTVVTETMAEVLHQQGHSEDALRVYRELEVRGGGDERLRRRIAELEGEPEPEPEPASEPEPSAEPSRRRFTATETNGESVAGFFGKLLAAHLPPGLRAPAVQSAPTPPVHEPDAAAAPTRPAADALSLSSVFGEEPTTLPPAVPAPGALAAGVSFDEFYGPSGSTSGVRSTRAPDAKKDDLDQFHAWLQNLKR
jgi:tetratricopeptide (TPR) repeat protein